MPTYRKKRKLTGSLPRDNWRVFPLLKHFIISSITPSLRDMPKTLGTAESDVVEGRELPKVTPDSGITRAGILKGRGVREGWRLRGMVWGSGFPSPPNAISAASRRYQMAFCHRRGIRERRYNRRDGVGTKRGLRVQQGGNRTEEMGGGIEVRRLEREGEKSDGRRRRRRNDKWN
jgi:hypothetical protein